LRTILANDDRPRTAHAYAERADPHWLPPVVADLLTRNDQRRTQRGDAWWRHTAAEGAREATKQHVVSQDRSCRLSEDGYGQEL
jgi:hypothetical protein